MRPAVRVEGLDELRRTLRRLENPDQIDAVRRIFRQGADHVRDEARMRANFFSFRLADVIRSGASVGRGLAAFVRGGSVAYPWYGWADFGSRNPRTGQARSVGPWANSGRGPRGGRFIYPAIERVGPDVAETIEDRLALIFNTD